MGLDFVDQCPGEIYYSFNPLVGARDNSERILLGLQSTVQINPGAISGLVRYRDAFPGQHQ